MIGQLKNKSKDKLLRLNCREKLIKRLKKKLNCNCNKMKKKLDCKMKRIQKKQD